MSSIQYTIRNVPKDIDHKLRLRAKKSNSSFNATVVEALRLSTVTDTKQSVSDLDWFYGSGGIGQAELDTFNSQRAIDKQAWNL